MVGEEKTLESDGQSPLLEPPETNAVLAGPARRPTPTPHSRGKEAGVIESITIHSRKRAGRCPACHDELGTDPLLDCEQCEARIHHDCRELLRACPTLGCTGTFPELAPSKPKHRVLHLLLALTGSLLLATTGSTIITGATTAFILFLARSTGEELLGLLAAGLIGGLAFLASFLIILPYSARHILEVLANMNSCKTNKPSEP